MFSNAISVLSFALKTILKNNCANQNRDLITLSPCYHALEG